jgi:hypothetical protein
VAAVEAVVFTFNRAETTGAVTRGAARLLAAMGFAPLLEVSLPNGRRADIMALGPKGQIAVKSSLEDYRADRKWGDYLAYCDIFAFAVPPEFPMDVLPPEPGLIVADAFDGAMVRDSPLSPLSGPRRKAITLAFARLAAIRATFNTAFPARTEA